MKRKSRLLYMLAATVISINILLEAVALRNRCASEKTHRIEAIPIGRDLILGTNPWMTELIHGQLPIRNDTFFSTGCGQVTCGCFFAVSWSYEDCVK